MAEVLQIVISVQDDGNVNISGPIHDKILCYGVLERAKDAVRSFKPGQIVGAVALPANLKGGV